MRMLFVVLFVVAMGIVRGQQPAAPPAGFAHFVATVNGIKIHYVKGGSGEPIVLLHGFGENWYMWHRIMPDLAKHFTVITPDLPGVGESGKPAKGYDKKTLAQDIHGLVKQLGYPKINLVGHDIGLMVAYAYAAQFPAEVKKLALLDAVIPGVEPLWSKYPMVAWWWGFFAWPASGELVAGKEKLFLTNFWPVVGYKVENFSAAEKAEFIRAYAVPGGTTGAFHWFGAFPQDVIDNKTLTAKKLPMPVLAMGGEHSTAGALADQVRQVATNVKGVIIPGAGHWLMEEATEPVRKGLLDFFTGN
ncbi:MAG TPA: alpha/beta hydrolase [Puia sp.]